MELTNSISHMANTLVTGGIMAAWIAGAVGFVIMVVTLYGRKVHS